MYQVLAVTDEDKMKFPSNFWTGNAGKLRTLSEIVLELISIPATSVQSEQNFSAACQLMSDRRENITSSIFDVILFINLNSVSVKE